MEQILEQLGINPGAIVVNIVGFLLMLYLLKRFAFGPITNLMQERSDSIERDLREASEKRAAAEEEYHRLSEHLDQMRDDFRADVARSTREAKQAIADLYADARVQRQQLVAQGEEEIRRARESMVIELRQKAAETAVQVASKLLQNTLNEERQAALVGSFIADINRIAAEMPPADLELNEVTDRES